MAANKLVDFYKEGISMPQLNEGEYKAKLIKHALIDTNPDNPYISLEFQTTNDRTLRENRFNQGFQIFISHLKQQLNRGDEEIGVQEFLDELVENETEFTIWITKYTPANGGQTRSNFHFLEPRKKSTDTGVTETAVEDKPEVEDAI